jgi:hypothetical protein
MHQQGRDQGREIEEPALKAALRQEADFRPHIDDFLRHARQRGSVLEERNGVYRFIHLAFQEFLAARYLREVIGGAGRAAILAFLADRLDDPWWREPTLLLAGYLATHAAKSARELLGALAATGRTPDAQFSAAELAGTAVLEWPVIKSYANTIIPIIRENSSNLIIVGTPTWSHNPDQAATDPITIDDNVAYALHVYSNQNADGTVDKDNISAMAAADKALLKIPLFMTEWGATGNNGLAPLNLGWADKWIIWAKKNGVSWAAWSLSNSGGASGALTSNNVTGGLSESGTFFKGKIPGVTAALGTGTIIPPVDPPIVPPVVTTLDTITLPGHIEAEKASTKSTGLLVETTTDLGGGSNLSNSINGSWAEYAVKITKAGAYTLRARIAATNAGTLTFKLNGVSIGTISVAYTGALQTWNSLETPVTLSATGAAKIRIEWSGTAASIANLNWIEFATATATAIHTIGSVTAYAHLPALVFDLMGHAKGSWDGKTALPQGTWILKRTGDQGSYTEIRRVP